MLRLFFVSGVHEWMPPEDGHMVTVWCGVVPQAELATMHALDDGSCIHEHTDVSLFTLLAISTDPGNAGTDSCRLMPTHADSCQQPLSFFRWPLPFFFGCYLTPRRLGCGVLRLINRWRGKKRPAVQITRWVVA